MNKVILIGNLGRDPELKYAGNGTAIANLSLATSYKGKDGEKVTEWHRCVAFGKTAEIMGQHLTKGSTIAVEGRLQTRSWEANGEKRYMTEVVVDRFDFVGAKPSADNGTGGFRNPVIIDGGPEMAGNFVGPGLNDDIPF